MTSRVLGGHTKVFQDYTLAINKLSWFLDVNVTNTDYQDTVDSFGVLAIIAFKDVYTKLKRNFAYN